MSKEEDIPRLKLGKLFNPGYQHPGMTNDNLNRSVRGQLFRPVLSNQPQGEVHHATQASPPPRGEMLHHPQNMNASSESPKLLHSQSFYPEKTKLVPQFTKSFSGFFGMASLEKIKLERSGSVESLGSDGEGCTPSPSPNSLSARFVHYMFQQPVGGCCEPNNSDTPSKSRSFVEVKKDVVDCGCANPLPFYKKLNAIAPTSL